MSIRELSYGEAICEALSQMLEINNKVFVIGVGVNSPWYMGNSTKDLNKKYNDRIIDIPISEAGITGIGVGAAASGMRPVVCHPRMDFMYLAMDAIINHASSAHYMFGGKVNIPIVIRGVINRGGEQSVQHSQSIHAMFAHVPGLKVVMPSTAYDAKGLMISAIKDNGPVIYIDDRWLYETMDRVPKNIYDVPIGKGIIRHEGKDLTVVATSYACHLANIVAEKLEKEHASIEVMDPRTIKPFDFYTLKESLHKTRKLLIIDGGWKTCGFAAEVSAMVAESKLFSILKCPIYRLTLPDCHAPASKVLEKEYYLNEAKIKSKIEEIIAK